ncbi:hypothetical protein K0B96_04215 [Horticoccus luteus]|uniref:Uncharacterized protein n=1 Tax=Horticoccus luteus TaxID=2862869 RepID=A0A8F9TYF8_9BACT|nr:hypothetical protein [Horticoccus luteus]QYM79832.1 hypothetical protein K0B96_04215 [Horticoccus luteus]
MTASTTRPRWWQWPTVLSLDAPAVALAWQWLVARAALFPLSSQHVIVLGTSTWLAYSADRWIEGWRLAPDVVQTPRHRFYQTQRRAIAVVWPLVFAADVAIALHWLTPRELSAGFILLGAVALYLLSHQFVHRHHRWRAPKEIIVTLLLAGGVGLFPVADPFVRDGVLGSAIGCVALLFFTNLVLISAWEIDVDAAHGQTSLALQFRRALRASRALPWGVAAGAGLAWVTVPSGLAPVLACTAVSALLLAGVDLAHHRKDINGRLARVLADAVLLTPAVLWLAAHLRR